MLPVIAGLVQRFVDGPDVTYKTSNNGTFKPNNVIANFANDGQINQILAGIGVFDNEPPLPANRTLPERKFRVSRFVTMRGTVALERLSCSAAAHTGYSTGNATSETYVRVKLNDVVYPVANCASGPGESCPLGQYQRIIEGKMDAVGDFKTACNSTNDAFAAKPTATFFKDNTLPFGKVVNI